MSSHERSVAIIGLGTLGMALSRELRRMGDKVVGIDVDEANVTRVCDEFTSTVVADASDLKAMTELGLEVFDAVVIAIGENLEANILAATHALELGCDSVWAKAQNETHRTILERIGVHHVMVPERNEGEHLAQHIHNPALRNFFEVTGDKLIADVRVPSHLLGKVFSVERLEQRWDLLFIGMLRHGEFHDRIRCETVLEADDRFILFGERRELRSFADRYAS